MQVISVNVGKATELGKPRGTTLTGIFKEPVSGPVGFEPEGVAGDFIGWRKGHGAPARAAYLYPREHYAGWCAFFRTDGLPDGYLGENLTTEGLTEATVAIGDRLRIGEAELLATCPRTPCATFTARVGNGKAGSFMMDRGWTGIYFAVTKPGPIRAGDRIEVLERDPAGIPVSACVAALAKRGTPDLLARLVAHPVLPDDLRRTLKRMQDRESMAG
ncbi:MOSC domain-containing protein YiiM [Faunimonas pinastri]|uniref:MOSC domain-containing protein YiiM n=1 Tax=Faunimonas pinastri TaxID=1855383 RepID=A0A1H9CU68_9HYPH|nr:MOSC domain-containing protein [Faunimonas pinastri]SEQ04750.1 MOSC domain-containing protein YiiM [Faunimonas pinastri]